MYIPFLLNGYFFALTNFRSSKNKLQAEVDHVDHEKTDYVSSVTLK